jgi:NAD(P)-dependent dehydrogenase (short-subunit alcohol dehydrogenase family)
MNASDTPAYGFSDKTVVITGGASGIGAAIAVGLAAHGTARIVIADLDYGRAKLVADSIGCEARRLDVGHEADVAEMINDIQRQSQIDFYFSNAGVGAPGGVETGDAVWDRAWAVNVMSHVFAFRALLHDWTNRRQGHFIVTASGAGLSAVPSQVAYTASKHAAVGLAESLRIRHAADGIMVSCVCPTAVNTPLLAETDPVTKQLVGTRSISASEAAAAILAGITKREFLIMTDDRLQRMLNDRCENLALWLERFSAVYHNATMKFDNNIGQ